MKARFRVQHEVLSGLKYVQLTKRKGIRVGKDEEMLGSYAPNTEDKPEHEKKCECYLIPIPYLFCGLCVGEYRLTASCVCCVVAKDEAPSGMIARGHYDAVSRFVDDDDHDHLKFEWSFNIAKNWE